jgi:hypothetical protein
MGREAASPRNAWPDRISMRRIKAREEERRVRTDRNDPICGAFVEAAERARTFDPLHGSQRSRTGALCLGCGPTRGEE